MNLSQTIPAWLRRHVTRAGARGLVVGLSGGIDSAVVARLAQIAMPDAVMTVQLPCHSDPQDEADARFLVDHFDLPARRIELDAAYDALVDGLRAGAASSRTRPAADAARIRLSLANVKPRLRMTALYYVANELDYLVAGTGNRCELAIGYFTKYGDGGVDLLPLGRLFKSDVRRLARELGVPDAIIDKPPSAGLWLGQTDEEEMGFTYADLEAYLLGGPESVAPALAVRIEQLMRTSAHKRELPPIFDPEQ